MTRSTGETGFILPASPPSLIMASRMAARSTIAGMPLKSCVSTLAGRKAISAEAFPLVVSHSLNFVMSSTVTLRLS